MIIILEGPDGAGKTTLANQLHLLLPYSWRLHRGPLRRDPFDEYEADLETWDGYTPIICDRWHLGELIYGPILRGASQLDKVARWHIEAFLLARGALQVIITAPLAELRQRLNARGDELVTPEMLYEISDGYFAAMEGNFLSTLICDDPINVPSILALAADCWAHAHALRSFPSYVGSPTPRYLLLGEKRHDNTVGPAFVPAAGTSGRFLLEHLLPALPGDVEIGLANASEENVVDLWHSLGRPKVCALGDVAYDQVMADINERGGHAFPLGATAHPQFVRRFHNRSGAQYARTILSALESSEDLRSWRPA